MAIGLDQRSDGFQPSATAPFIGQGDLLSAVTRDRSGTLRAAPTELGLFKR